MIAKHWYLPEVCLAVAVAAIQSWLSLCLVFLFVSVFILVDNHLVVILHDVGIMDLALITYLGHFGLNLRPLFNKHTGYRYRVDLLMRLPVPFVESREVRSTSGRFACKELHALCRTPLSRRSSGDPQPGTKTKASQNLYCCIP